MWIKRLLMKNYRVRAQSNCKKFGQLFLCLLVLSFLRNAYGQHLILRAPATYVPNVEINIIPDSRNTWLQNLLVEDSAGVLRNIRHDIKTWREMEEYVEMWDLESTGLYKVPTRDEKKRYLDKKMLRYLDKRLAGEIKDSKKGSTLYRVGQVRKTLRPKVEARLWKNLKIKFRAKVLRGRGYIVFINPWVDAKATFSASGKVEMEMKKNIKQIGVNTHLQYNVDRDEWFAQLDKKLTDKITARISSHQDDKTMIFSKDSNQTIQLMYNYSF